MVSHARNRKLLTIRMLITLPETQSALLGILFFILLTLLLPLGKRKLVLMVPCINYIENHFLMEKREIDFFFFFFYGYKVTFLSGELKVQEGPTFS